MSITEHLSAQIFLVSVGLIGIGFTILLPNNFSLIIAGGCILVAFIWFFIELFNENSDSIGRT